MDNISFDPFTQNVTFLGPDGKTTIGVPIPVLDAFNDESISVCINYGAQVGACILTLFAVLAITPSAKLRRRSAVLHLVGLLICIARNALLMHYFLSPLNHFYGTWSGDNTAVSQVDLRVNVFGNVVSLLLVVVVEVALMHQAWTMVTLWPNPAKYGLLATSAIITLMTIGWRFASTVIQNEAVLELEPPIKRAWIIHASVITNVLSIAWFCALFNTKLVMHLITNRSILPSSKTLTSMEVLAMTNGILMVVPVIFAGLEWARIPNFESGSLTLSSVAIILPMGTLAAQQVTRSTTSAGNNLAYLPRSGPANGRSDHGLPGAGGHRSGTAPSAGRGTANVSSLTPSTPPIFEHPNLAMSCGFSPGAMGRRSSLMSRRGRGPGSASTATTVAATQTWKASHCAPDDDVDLELRRIDSITALSPSVYPAIGLNDGNTKQVDERIY